MARQTKKTILFVDDDPVYLKQIADQFKETLGTDHFRYEKANNAEEAEEVIVDELSEKGQLPALMIVDWLMPGKRGDELIQMVSRLYPEIPIMLHSALAQDDIVDKLNNMDINFRGSLPKPWDGQTRLEEINQIVC
jgi:DNA-binding response OmpR family regulator